MFARNFSFLLVVLVAAVQFVSCGKALIQEPTSPSTPAPTTDVSTQQINERGIQILGAMRCGEIEGNKVVHGNQTKLNEFTFMALLKYDTAEIYGCGGSVITNRFILTAAHCWVGQRNNLIGVRLGEHDYSTDLDCTKRGRQTFCNPPVEDYGIDKLIPHPLYRKEKIDHDIGLIRLDRDIIFKDKVHIQPICLPIYADSQGRPIAYIIAGWGTTELETTSTVLLQAIIPHRQREFCQNIFTRANITDDLICAGGDNFVNSCISESGGPLFIHSVYNRIPRYVQYGIGAAGACPNNHTSVYIKIISYLPWLTNEIAQNE